MPDRALAGDRQPDPPKVRLEAIVVPGELGATLEAVAELDLDRVPDPEGQVRVVVTPDEVVQLAERGYEVRIVRAIPVTPLDPKLVMDDESAKAWLEVRVQGIERQAGS